MISLTVLNEDRADGEEVTNREREPDAGRDGGTKFVVGKTE